MDAFGDWLSAERGRLTKLANAIGVTHGAISQWRRVPAERVGQVSAVTGIPHEALRPDLFNVEAAQ